MHHVNPLKVDMKVNNQFIKFEVDTGSGITLISESTYQKILSNYQLSKTNITVKTYANESLNVLGKIKVVMQYKESVFTNFLLNIVPGNGVNLLGRTWLSEIKLDWTSLFNVHKEQVNNVNKSESISGQLEHLVKNYSEIFSDNLGLMKGFKVKINVEPNASPKFVKARTVPFAMKDVVEAEIDKMEKDGILKSVSFSDWASPIVIVPKPDGNIRICGDINLWQWTINPVIKNDTYPQPTPEELFSKRQGGKKFSKIDLTKAYLQLELDEESQKFLTINTSKGLKHFTILPY